MKPYSKDLRLRVLSAVDAGKPREEVARTFSVSMPTIKRWLKRRRETGDVEPEPIPGRLTRISASGRSKKRCSICSSTSSMRFLRARISVASAPTMRAAIDSAGRVML
jgi:transposase